MKSQLLALTQEREAILTSKASNTPRMKAKACAEITTRFNACLPGRPWAMDQQASEKMLGPFQD